MHPTFGWAPIDLAAAMANVEVIVKERLWENAARMGARFLAACKKFEMLPHVGEVRGIGLVVGLDIVIDKRTYQPDFRRAEAIHAACYRAGLLTETAGNVLFMTPPLTVSAEQIDTAVQIFESALA
jgi:4-aminobutyrate aminotransferase-like enzyme